MQATVGPHHITEAQMGSSNVEVFCTCTVIARKHLLSRSYVAVNHIGKEITVLARGCKRGNFNRRVPDVPDVAKRTNNNGNRFFL
jgi:hypothetical protein